MSSTDVQRIVEFVNEQAHSPTMRQYCQDLLCEMLAIDTCIQSDVARLRKNENRLHAIIERELVAIASGNVHIRREPITCRIQEHPYYSQLYYTRAPGAAGPLSCQQTYQGRSNLVAIFPADALAAKGTNALYNAHIDCVAPFIAPRVDGPLVYGRGACDDKGEVVLLIAQIRIVEEARKRFGLTFGADRVYQFVIEEEMGGNGSLSLVIDGQFAGHEAIIHEITTNLPHPGNRGCVWYQCALTSAGVASASAEHMWPFVIHALEAEGAQIKAESAHPLFRPEHVQTNHGMLDIYGKHPSAVNDHVAFSVTATAQTNLDRLMEHLREISDAAVHEYVQRYGDKTQETDPETGKPKVARHYSLTVAGTASSERRATSSERQAASEEPREASGGPIAFRLDVYGKAGHMGAVARCDGAITKAAFMLLPLMQLGKVSVALADTREPTDPLVLEGGQGFVPTHDMDQIMHRLCQAAARGVQDYCSFAGVLYKPEMSDMRFDKLHNNAFACDVNSPGMRSFRWAFESLGKPWPEPTGWQVSCDARIFARHGHNVVTFGPGSLKEAHSDSEHLDLRQMQEGLAISTLQALNLGGAV